MPNYIYSAYNTNLFVINDPNAEEVLCNIDTASIWLGGRRATMGLPNIPIYNQTALTESECDTIISGISDINYGFDKIIVFPSPATNFINIVIPTGFSNIEISINNLQHQKMQEINFPSAEQQIQMDIQNLNPGIYTVSIKSCGKLIAVEKFVKL